MDELIKNIQYCQKEKGLEIFAWIIMSNHWHLILRAAGNNKLSDIIRDFKKHTSKSIYRAINVQESRKSWLLKVLSYEGKIWFCAEGYHGEEIISDSKLNYIHLNPVRAGIVEKEEDYLNSSAGELYGLRQGKLILSRFG